METSPVNFRRWAAGIFLVAAVLMLVLGMTHFSDRLEGKDFLIYWLTCFLFTGLAALFALIDVAIIRRQSRNEQRELIKETLEKTERDVNKFRPPDSEK